VRQYSWILGDLKNNAMQDIVILSGDHLYRMDYMKFVEYHRRSDADVTIGCLPCSEEDARGFGLMKIDDDANIVDFAEKPSGERLDEMRVSLSVSFCFSFCPSACQRELVCVYLEP
jgi:glucose-1-phosphate adenylyltransferase